MSHFLLIEGHLHLAFCHLMAYAHRGEHRTKIEQQVRWSQIGEVHETLSVNLVSIELLDRKPDDFCVVLVICSHLVRRQVYFGTPHSSHFLTSQRVICRKGGKLLLITSDFLFAFK